MRSGKAPTRGRCGRPMAPRIAFETAMGNPAFYYTNTVTIHIQGNAGVDQPAQVTACNRR